LERGHGRRSLGGGDGGGQGAAGATQVGAQRGLGLGDAHHVTNWAPPAVSDRLARLPVAGP